MKKKQKSDVFLFQQKTSWILCTYFWTSTFPSFQDLRSEVTSVTKISCLCVLRSARMTERSNHMIGIHGEHLPSVYFQPHKTPETVRRWSKIQKTQNEAIEKFSASFLNWVPPPIGKVPLSPLEVRHLLRWDPVQPGCFLSWRNNQNFPVSSVSGHPQAAIEEVWWLGRIIWSCLRAPSNALNLNAPKSWQITSFTWNTLLLHCIVFSITHKARRVVFTMQLTVILGFHTNHMESVWPQKWYELKNFTLTGLLLSCLCGRTIFLGYASRSHNLGPHCQTTCDVTKKKISNHQHFW